MKENDFNIRKNVIEETFDDNRKIVSSVEGEELNLDGNVHKGGDIFITSEGEFIDLELQTEDYTEEEHAKYIEFAEELYEKYGKKVSIYILCPKNVNVCVREFEIPSSANFNIKIACISEDSCKIILNSIKTKYRTGKMLTEDDLMALGKLHEICKKKKNIIICWNMLE